MPESNSLCRNLNENNRVIQLDAEHFHDPSNCLQTMPYCDKAANVLPFCLRHGFEFRPKPAERAEFLMRKLA